MLLSMSIQHISLKCPVCCIVSLNWLEVRNWVVNILARGIFSVWSILLCILSFCTTARKHQYKLVSLCHILILHSTDKEKRVVCSNKCSHDDLTMFKNINSDSKNLIFSKAFNTSFTDADNMDTSLTTITQKLMGNRTKWSYRTPRCWTFRILPLTKKK